jgi:hypothetical protein
MRKTVSQELRVSMNIPNFNGNLPLSQTLTSTGKMGGWLNVSTNHQDRHNSSRRSSWKPSAKKIEESSWLKGLGKE